MTEHRTHDEGPPSGVPERRCSDDRCMEARNRWFVEELLPKLTVRFWVGIAITVGGLGSANFFIMNSMLNKHELQMYGVFEQRNVHKEDITRVEDKVDAFIAKMDRSVEDIGRRLDRNLDEIKTVHRK